MINISNEMRELIASDFCHKNVRITFPNGEHSAITNEHIISESLSFTESLFSNSFKFGLCESSVLQFSTFDDANIKGCEINVALEIMQNGVVKLTIPYGVFKVKSCKRKANSTERQIVAYSLDLAEDDEDVSTSQNRFGALSPFEYLKRRTPVSKATYMLDLWGSVYSNWRVSSSMWSNVSIMGVDETFDGSGSYNGFLAYPTFKKYYLDVTDYSLYRFIALTRKEINTFAENNANRVYTLLTNAGATCDINDVKSALKWGATAGCSLLDEEEDMTGDYPIIQPHVNLTSTDQTKANNNRYYIVLPTKIRFQVTATTETTVGTVLIPKTGVGSLYQIRPTWSDSAYFAEYSFKLPRTKYSKNSTKYDFPYFTNVFEVNGKKVNLKKMFEAYLELNALYGIADRNGGIALKSITAVSDGLMPTSSLKPTSTLVPADGGSVESIFQSLCSSVWYGDEVTKLYGKVICTCTPSDASEAATYEVDILRNPDEVDCLVYDVSSNYLIKNFPPKAAEIEPYLQIIANALNGFQYMPVDVTQKGLPYIEAGDWVQYMTNDTNVGCIQTIVARRTIKGIQTLIDTISVEE